VEEPAMTQTYRTLRTRGPLELHLGDRLESF
jgi:hypothetical protein